MRYALLAIVAFVALGAYVALTGTPQEAQKPVDTSLSIIEIAGTLEERTQGLSGRKPIPDDYGMLFVFEEEEVQIFWMKDMLAPIDIIWLAEDGKIIGIEDSVAPETYPKTFSSPRSVRYVLETRAGLAKERGWSADTILDLPL